MHPRSRPGRHVLRPAPRRAHPEGGSLCSPLRYLCAPTQNLISEAGTGIKTKPTYHAPFRLHPARDTPHSARARPSPCRHPRTSGGPPGGAALDSRLRGLRCGGYGLSHPGQYHRPSLQRPSHQTATAYYASRNPGGIPAPRTRSKSEALTKRPVPAPRRPRSQEKGCADYYRPPGRLRRKKSRPAPILRESQPEGLRLRLIRATGRWASRHGAECRATPPAGPCRRIHTRRK